jgi:hypothetical protein
MKYISQYSSWKHMQTICKKLETNLIQAFEKFTQRETTIFEH